MNLFFVIIFELFLDFKLCCSIGICFFVYVLVNKYFFGLFIFEIVLYYLYRIILKFKFLNLVDYFFC